MGVKYNIILAINHQKVYQYNIRNLVTHYYIITNNLKNHPYYEVSGMTSSTVVVESAPVSTDREVYFTSTVFVDKASGMCLQNLCIMFYPEHDAKESDLKGTLEERSGQEDNFLIFENLLLRQKVAQQKSKIEKLRVRNERCEERRKRDKEQLIKISAAQVKPSLGNTEEKGSRVGKADPELPIAV